MANPGSAFSGFLRRYRTPLVLAGLVGVGLAVPTLAAFLEKSGEGYEFHNLFVYVSLLLAWFLLTTAVVDLGAPLRWAVSIGAAPTGAASITGLLRTASNYAAAGQNFWLLVATGDGQAIAAVLLELGWLFLVGIPLALLAFVFGCTSDQYLRDGHGGRLSRAQSILLVGLAILSLYFGYYLGKTIPPTVLYPRVTDRLRTRGGRTPVVDRVRIRRWTESQL